MLLLLITCLLASAVSLWSGRRGRRGRRGTWKGKYKRERERERKKKRKEEKKREKNGKRRKRKVSSSSSSNNRDRNRVAAAFGSAYQVEEFLFVPLFCSSCSTCQFGSAFLTSSSYRVSQSDESKLLNIFLLFRDSFQDSFEFEKGGVRRGGGGVSSVFTRIPPGFLGFLEVIPRILSGFFKRFLFWGEVLSREMFHELFPHIFHPDILKYLNVFMRLLRDFQNSIEIITRWFCFVDERDNFEDCFQSFCFAIIFDFFTGFFRNSFR